MFTGAHVITAYIALHVDFGAWSHADTVGGADHYHVIHDEGGHGGADVDIVIAVGIGVAQSFKEVYHAVFTELRVGEASFGIQGHQVEAGGNGQDACFVTVTPEGHTTSRAFAGGVVEALAFLGTPHPQQLTAGGINRHDVTG